MDEYNIINNLANANEVAKKSSEQIMNKHASHMKIKAADIAKNITMNVKIVGLSALSLRVKIATQLIRLAANVAGVCVQIEAEHEQ